MLAVAALATACSKDDDHAKTPDSIGEVGYFSIRAEIPSEVASRASAEEGATAPEGTIHTLYAIAFDASNKVTTPSGASLPYVKLTGTDLSQPEAFKMTTNAKGLLLVANPGTQLETVITGLVSGSSSFDDFNKAIKSVTVAEIVDGTKGYTMINTGSMLPNDKADDADNAGLCLVAIPKTKIKVVGEGSGEYQNESDAKNAAKSDQVTIKIERLSSKLFVKTAGTGVQPVAPHQDGVFVPLGWTVDVLNTTFYPWAQKVKLNSVPSTATFYTSNFYTIDPNYDNNTGLTYKGRNATTLLPDATFETLDATGNLQYCIENTMRASEQRWKNATRIIVKAQYWPYSGGSGDWFRFRETVYKTFADLMTEYTTAQGNDTKPSFRAACDLFYTRLKAYATANGISSFTANKFEEVTDAMLGDAKFKDVGGEVTRVADCIRWYKDGLNYYYYELTHDDASSGASEYAKYGIVRNNWYKLTVATVGGWGTPWYPSVDPNDPDPDGPDPEDKIDGAEGWLGVTVEVGPWVSWEKEIHL